MNLFVLLYLYATVAFLVSGYIYFRGVVRRPRPREFAFEHRAVLGLTTLAVGILWILFMPALAVHYGIRLARLAVGPVQAPVVTGTRRAGAGL